MKRTKGIRFQLFFPVLLLLILFPLAAVGIFGMTSSEYLRIVAEREIEELLADAEAVADEAYGEAAAQGGTEKEREKEEARLFLAGMRNRMKKRTSNADIMIFSSKKVQTYPRASGTDEWEAVLSELFLEAISGETGPQTGFQRISTARGEYLLNIVVWESSANVRAKYLVAYTPVLDASPLLLHTQRLVFFITVLLAAIAALILWFVTGRILRPLESLSKQAGEIGKGQFSAVSGPYSARELEELRLSFNRMTENLKELDDRQKTFFQNASHELRTPLTSISGYAQGIECGVFPDHEKVAGIILAESLKLRDMVDEILKLSKMDLYAYEAKLRSICLQDFLQQQAESLEGAFSEADRELVLCGSDEDSEPVYVCADEKLLSDVLRNLLSNGLRYAKARVTLSCRTDEAGAFAEIFVSDDGEGIVAADLPHIFERFYKGEKGKFGLGLCIAKTSAEYMKGDLFAENTETGARFVLRLPLWKEQ